MTVGKAGGANTKRWLWVGLGVVALAAVVFLGGALATPDADKPAPSTEPSPALRAQQLTRDAQEALSKNDTPTALSLAQRALAADPANAAARAVVVKATSRPEPVEAAPTAPAKAPKPDKKDDKYSSAVKNLSSLLPAKLDGWVEGQTVDMEPDVIVTYQPAPDSTADAQVERAVFSVHDLESEKKAKRFVAKVDKVAYPASAATVAVGSREDVYFGTNGSGSAVVAFSRGRFAFEVLIVAEQGVDPATLQSVALELASALPAAE